MHYRDYSVVAIYDESSARIILLLPLCGFLCENIICTVREIATSSSSTYTYNF